MKATAEQSAAQAQASMYVVRGVEKIHAAAMPSASGVEEISSEVERLRTLTGALREQLARFQVE